MNTPSLNPDQRSAVSHGEGPLLIVAGAGSGKTRTLTARLAALIGRGIPPERILAITFTNKAAGEMARRVEELVGPFPKQTPGREPFIGTFHSFGARILRAEAARFGRTPNFTIFDSDDSRKLIERICAEEEVNRRTASIPHIIHLISRTKAELADPSLMDELPAAVFRAYEAALKRQNAFDFDDLLEKPVRAFQRDAALLARYQKRFDYILVDEFQDVNTVQYALVRMLAARHHNLNAVGDDAQSIYGFRGSDFRNFLNFEKDWADARVVVLDQNYRSTDAILAGASALISHNKLQKPKRLWTERTGGTPIAVHAARTPDEEAEWIAERIGLAIGGPASRKKGIRLADQPSSKLATPTIAVLYRTNAQSRALEQTFIVADIPYRIFGGLAFYERKEIKDIVAGLRIAANPKDEVSADRLRKALPKRMSEPLVHELAARGASTPLELIGFFLERTDYFGRLARTFENAADRKENIEELIAFAGTFADIPAFLERVSLFQSADTPSARSRKDGKASPVHLMTIHLAKGLEFDRVFVAGCAEGTLPHHRSLTSFAELEEERRLMYVAMTRARHELALSFSGFPSRFLAEIPPELISLTASREGLAALTDTDAEEFFSIDT